MATNNNAANAARDSEGFEAACRKAKTQFLEKIQGATLQIPTKFHHRIVIRAYLRTYYIVIRHWDLATNLTRSVLKDPAASTQLQDVMLHKASETERWLKDQIQQMQQLGADFKDLLDQLEHGASHEDKVVMIGPLAMKFRSVLMTADQLLDLVTGLYTVGALDENQYSTCQYEVKKRLRAIQSSVRAHCMLVLQKVNGAGKSRPGYVTPEAGTTEDGVAAGDAAADAPTNDGSAEPVQVDPQLQAA